MKVVLDTNVIISGIFWSGPPYEIIKLWENKKISVICSDSILTEILTVLKEFKMPETQAKWWHKFIENNSIMIEPAIKVNICEDKDDNKFLETAIDGKAKYIITGDKHLLKIKEYEKIKIIPPKEFLQKTRG
jgi:uncharacterized protein